jgi:hypothetical protein
LETASGASDREPRRDHRAESGAHHQDDGLIAAGTKDNAGPDGAAGQDLDAGLIADGG